MRVSNQKIYLIYKIESAIFIYILKNTVFALKIEIKRCKIISKNRISDFLRVSRS